MTMTDDDIAEQLQRSARTARRYLAEWSARQGDPRVPRVALRRTGRRGRPAYVVDMGDFGRWAAGAAAAGA